MSVDWPDPVTVEQMYGPWPLSDEAVAAALDASRSPRSVDALYDVFGGLGIGPDHAVLDIGARDARHSVRLAARFGCRVVAVDPIEANVANARAAVADHEHGTLVEVRRGSIEEMPAAEGEFDAVWCRDMLNHVADIDAALGECHRVLAASGAMIVYQTFATDLLEAAEAARLYAGVAIVADRMSVAGFEDASRRSGFAIETTDVIASEWREAWEEDGTGTTARQLLHAARLLRKRSELLAEMTEVPYRVELANALWGVYQMIGKLEPRIYVLRR